MIKLQPPGLQYFGTDGIRGTVGQDPITPEFFLRLGWAVGRTVFSESGALALIGKDTRISGYLIESVLEAGLVSAGVNVGLLGPIPTPATAYLAQTLGADLGLMISASHNAYTDNGIKFFNRNGQKLSELQEQEIEELLTVPMSVVQPWQLGKAHRVEDALDRYVEFCKSAVVDGADLRGLNIVLDCAHGAGYRAAPRVFEELGAEVNVLAVEPDGMNINDQCGSMDTRILVRTVQEFEANIGIALDGDGDRVVMVDETGMIFDGDDLLYVIAHARHRANRLSGGVVGTTMSNLGLEHALRDLGIPFLRSDVGDRSVQRLVAENGWNLGGESSGHLLCLDIAQTGDGIVSALQVLSVIRETGKSLAELTEPLNKYPQILVNVDVPHPRAVSESAPIRRACRDLERTLGESGRVLVRSSGTEPVVRVMVEAMEPGLAETYAKRMEALVRQEGSSEYQ